MGCRSHPRCCSRRNPTTLRCASSGPPSRNLHEEEGRRRKHQPRATLQRDGTNRSANEETLIKGTAPAGLWRRRVVLRTNSAGPDPDGGGDHAQGRRHRLVVLARAPGRHGGAAGVPGFGVLGFWSEAEASRGREGWRRKERGKAGLAALRKLAACFMHRAKAGRAAGRERERNGRGASIGRRVSV